MTPEQFWGLIKLAGDRCRENGTNIEEEMERELVQIPADEIVSFDGLLQAYLWVARECVIRRTDAHVCEGFHHLLVAAGQDAFLAAVVDPAAAVAGHDGQDVPRNFCTSPPLGLTSGRRTGTWACGTSAGTAATTPASSTKTVLPK